MSWTVTSLVLPLVLLCTWRLQEGAQACTCGPAHPQTAFCQADVVIKAKVLARNDVVGLDEPIMYDLKQTKMFKGPDWEVDAIYTTAFCGVTLTKGVQYLITGRLAPDGSLHAIVCDFIVPWDSLTASQKVNLVERYEKGCDCQITLCHAAPCKSSSPAECLWTDFLASWGSREQARHFACVRRSDGSCAWIRGAPSPKNAVRNIKGG
ncbi:metalloproteinase inhibitor 2-like [Dunckerocampus dactyliophorus]|uniref:metalloproteinase inhibitor 2-like n=1 Tax=Dunckerocampus dactyliophorus TaxID=161453 RepID=UPI0024066BBA|nr:metalloproteinase inhibitor 2-like [Dunckerocampus dactyliophorus]